MKTIYREIGESLKILGAVADYLELAALNRDFDIQRDSLLGAACTMNEAIQGIVDSEDRTDDRWDTMREALEALREKAA